MYAPTNPDNESSFLHLLVTRYPISDIRTPVSLSPPLVLHLEKEIYAHCEGWGQGHDSMVDKFGRGVGMRK